MPQTTSRAGRALGLLAVVAAAVAIVPAPTASARGRADELPVVFVANAENGTVSVVDTRRLRVLRELDVVPDGADADAVEDDAVHALVGQRLVELAGGLNYAQDTDVSPDGRTLYVSRGHRGDVAAFRIRTGRLLWKVRTPGLRSDHMTISDDGRRLYVSALTADVVQAIDARRGAVSGSFPTGQWPHDNHVSADGARVYNGSIGNILLPEQLRSAMPASYQLTVADAETLEVERTYRFERGIRPFEIADDERSMYAQLSLESSVIEFDLDRGTVRRRLELPVDARAGEDDYDFEAPHHGLALSPDEQTLCLAGRISDYVALVSTRTMRLLGRPIEVGDGPGWAENAPGGSRCVVANTRADTLSVISYRKRREIARLHVGDGPKHITPARIPLAVACGASRRGACR